MNLRTTTQLIRCCVMLTAAVALSACAKIDVSQTDDTGLPYHQQFIEFYQDR